jgi:TorA maturation chaperone TorD
MLDEFLKERSKLTGAEKEEFDLNTRRYYTRILCLTDSVPTMESYYVSPLKIAMQDARDEVLKYYSDFGLTKPAKYNEYEDFIAYEMRFMAFMADKTVSALKDNSMERAKELCAVQLDFLKQHPDRWVGEFTDRLSKHREAERVYLPVARIMTEFIRQDISFLGDF